MGHLGAEKIMNTLKSLNLATGHIHITRILFIAFFSLFISACSGPQKPAVPARIPIQITAYNHTQDYIHQYYIDGDGGGNVSAYGISGIICCGSIPEKWYEGLTATVKWTTSSGIPGDRSPGAGIPTWHEKKVAIEPYTRPVNVIAPHFLPNGEVRLIVSSQLAGGQGYPGPGRPVAPLDWKK